jgi:hypothetical protein
MAKEADEMDIEVPDGVTLVSQPDAPSLEEKLGTLWNPSSTMKLFRLTLGPLCESCGRPGGPQWKEVDGGMFAIAKNESHA